MKVQDFGPQVFVRDTGTRGLRHGSIRHHYVTRVSSRDFINYKSPLCRCDVYVRTPLNIKVVIYRDIRKSITVINNTSTETLKIPIFFVVYF